VTLLDAPRLADWQSYYVVVGSAAAALIGVQFVVITLVATMRRQASAETIGAFATPTVVHLGAALLVSALMCAPWHSIQPLSWTLATSGVAGAAYGAVVIRRARLQTGYKPVGEDWLWHAALPCGAYALLGAGAPFLLTGGSRPFLAVGAAALALLFIGIHNAWDTVTHLVVSRSGRDDP
jgi:hypothetical protein